MSELWMLSEGRDFHRTLETLWPTYLATGSTLDLADIAHLSSNFATRVGNLMCACATLLGATALVPTHPRVGLKFLRSDCGKLVNGREKMDREQLLLLEEAAVHVLVSYLA